MPTPTFLRLPPVKQDAIFQAAVAEFAQQRFSEASINRVVKAAAIPRGSFYQYFADKADRFMSVLDRVTAEIREQAAPPSDPRQGDTLSRFAAALAVSVDLAGVRPEYARLLVTQAAESEPFVREYFDLQDEERQAVVRMLERDKQLGLLRASVDAAAVVDMVYLLARELFYSPQADFAANQKRMDAFLDIIRRGARP